MWFCECQGVRVRSRRLPCRRGYGRRAAGRHRPRRKRRPRYVPARLRLHDDSLSVRAGEVARIGPAEVRSRYGVDPHRVPDFIALRGDPSDKLPGVAGLGAAGAAQVLRTYGTLENALKAGRFSAQAKNLRLFRSIATMDRKAPLPRLGGQQPTWHKAAALAQDWELKQLAKRLDDLAAQSSAAKPFR